MLKVKTVLPLIKLMINNIILMVDNPYQFREGDNLILTR